MDATADPPDTSPVHRQLCAPAPRFVLQCPPEDLAAIKEGYLLDLMPDAPCRPPAWRFILARLLVECGRTPTSQSDPSECAIYDLVRRLRTSSSTATMPPDPAALEQALDIYASAGPARWVIEAALLAGETDFMIADRLGLDPAVVEQYEPVFFEVRDRLNCSLGALGLAGAPSGRLEPTIAAVLQAFAHGGGTRVLDDLLRVFGLADWIPQPRRRQLLDQSHDDLPLRALIAAQVTPLNERTGELFLRVKAALADCEASQISDFDKNQRYREIWREQIELVRLGFSEREVRDNPLLRFVVTGSIDSQST